MLKYYVLIYSQIDSAVTGPKHRTEAVFKCQFVKNNENAGKRYDRPNIIRLFKFSFEHLVRNNDLSNTVSKLRTKIMKPYESNCSETRSITLRAKTLRVFNSDIANKISGPFGIMFLFITV